MKLVINSKSFSNEVELTQLSTLLHGDYLIKFEQEELNSKINFFWKSDEKVLDSFGLLLNWETADLDVVREAVEEAKECNCSMVVIFVEAPRRDQEGLSQEQL
jgi:K+-sensing histidine kinase KdpD